MKIIKIKYREWLKSDIDQPESGSCLIRPVIVYATAMYRLEVSKWSPNPGCYYWCGIAYFESEKHAIRFAKMMKAKKLYQVLPRH